MSITLLKNRTVLFVPFSYWQCKVQTKQPILFMSILEFYNFMDVLASELPLVRD